MGRRKHIESLSVVQCTSWTRIKWQWFCVQICQYHIDFIALCLYVATGQKFWLYEFDKEFLSFRQYITERYIALADLGGGACPAHAPLWDPILSFSHTFSPKSAHARGPRPPNGCMPPLREILDLPLHWSTSGIVNVADFCHFVT